MVGFGNVVIFILATVRRNGKLQQDFPTNFEARLQPIACTWGSLFPQLFFVVGSDSANLQFVQSSRCRSRPDLVSNSNLQRYVCLTNYVSSNEERKRSYDTTNSNNTNKHIRNSSVAAKADTVFGSLSVAERFRSNYASNSFPSDTVSAGKTFNVLYTKNCTGEYFGKGPTCRCQEAMRYYYYLTDIQGVKGEWFLFMDDDVYIRPYSLLAFLSQLSCNNGSCAAFDKAIALIPSATSRGFSFSKKKYREKKWISVVDKIHNKKLKETLEYLLGNPVTDETCLMKGVHTFYLAQPAFLNRCLFVCSITTFRCFI